MPAGGPPVQRATSTSEPFEIRAYPVPPIPELRPGMSVYGRSTGAEQQMKAAPPAQGYCWYATREIRWMWRDRVALFLILGVPLIAFSLLAYTFS